MDELSALLSESGDGISASLAAAAAGSGASSWVTKYAVSARCLRRPLGTGHVFAVPVTGLGKACLPGKNAPGTSSPGHARLLKAARQAMEAAGRGGDGGEEELALADMQMVAQGSAGGVGWIAFEVAGTAPRGTVTVAPSTDIRIAE